MWHSATKDSKVQELRHHTIRSSLAADEAGRRKTLQDEEEFQEDMMVDDDSDPRREDDARRFAFDFKSIQKPFQTMLFQQHDRLRKNVASLWSARKQFESVLNEYQKFKETGRAPQFADSFTVPKCVLGMPFPTQEGPTAGRSIQEVIDSFKTSQLATKVDYMVKVKEAVVDHFKSLVSLQHYSSTIKDQLDLIIDELRAMSLDLDFQYEAWYDEAKKFAKMSFEHVLFAKASKAVIDAQKLERLNERQTQAQAAFSALPKEAQLEMIIESKVSNILSRGRSEPGYRKLCFNPKERQSVARAISAFNGEFGTSYNGRGPKHDARQASRGKGKGKGKGRGKHSSHNKDWSRSPSRQASQYPHQDRRRSVSNSRERRTKGKGKGKAKGNGKGKAAGKGKRKGLPSAARPPSWSSRRTNSRATFNQRRRTPSQHHQGSGGGWRAARW